MVIVNFRLLEFSISHDFIFRHIFVVHSTLEVFIHPSAVLMTGRRANLEACLGLLKDTG